MDTAELPHSSRADSPIAHILPLNQDGLAFFLVLVAGLDFEPRRSLIQYAIAFWSGEQSFLFGSSARGERGVGASVCQIESLSWAVRGLLSPGTTSAGESAEFLAEIGAEGSPQPQVAEIGAEGSPQPQVGGSFTDVML